MDTARPVVSRWWSPRAFGVIRRVVPMSKTDVDFGELTGWDAGPGDIYPLKIVTWWVGEVEQMILQDPRENEHVYVNDEMFVDLEEWE